tara:strand:- start:3331 stop:4050 length:720 start_codon:yes stop_codon:yes gene_type:complete
MGVTLTGKAIKDTYEGLLKVANNTGLTTGVSNVTDGFGNSSALFLSPTDVRGRAMYSNQTNLELDSASDDALATKGWVGTQTAASTTFISLTDTPLSYANNAHRRVSVNAAGSGVEFTPEYFDFACGDETTALTTGEVFSIQFPRAINDIESFAFTLKVAPTGSNITINVKKNGSSIYSVNKATIDASTTSTVNSIVSFGLSSNVQLAEGDILTVHVDQIGSTIAGSGLKGFMTYNKVI